MLGVVPEPLISLGKPEVVTAIGLVTKETFHDFVPFNSSKRMPPGVPCRKSLLSFVGRLFTASESGGVDNNQKDYASHLQG